MKDTSAGIDAGKHRRSRPPEYYDSLVWERSPITGVLSRPVTTHPSGIPIGEPKIIVDEDYTLEATRSHTLQRQSRAFRKALWLSSVVAFLGLTAGGWGVFSASAGNETRATSQKRDAETQAVSPKKTIPARNTLRSASPPKAAPLPPIAPPRINQPELKPRMATSAADGTGGATADANAASPKTNRLADYDALLTSAKKSGLKSKKVAFLKKAIDANPRGDEALARLAVLLMESPKTRPEALDVASRAVAANSDNAMAWLAIGYIHQMNGDGEQAKRAYGKCAAASGPKRFVRDCRGLI